MSQATVDQIEVDEPSEAEAEESATEAPGQDEVRDDRVEALTLDQKFELLKNQRRRRILRYLMENGETATTGELSEHVAALENGIEVSSLSSGERKAAYVGLYQCHLPKMDDYGVIDFNQARGTIELNDLAYELEPNLVEQPSTSWWLRYSSIAVLGGIVYGLSIVAGAAALSPIVVIGLIAAIVTCASIHYREEQRDR